MVIKIQFTPLSLSRLQNIPFKKGFKKGQESWRHVLQFGLKPENLFLNIEKVKRRLEQFNVLFFQNL